MALHDKLTFSRDRFASRCSRLFVGALYFPASWHRLSGHRYMVAIVLCAVSLSAGAILTSEPISPLPLTVEFDRAKAKLGEKLFSDKRLSVDNSTSCSTCHLPEAWGSENKPVSIGIKGQAGTRNSPTVYNSVFNFSQFWDGRAADLTEQARGPVTSSVEMGMGSWEEVVEKLKSDTAYQQEFESAFGSGITVEHIIAAIVEYEKTLVTLNAPFDRFLRGETDAISEEQKRGYGLFKSYGCTSCHQGRNVGGNMFQKFGVMHDIALQEGTLGNDLGRYNVTKNEWDKRVFKVPSLRLVTKTPPYFHDGSVATIDEAVGIMIRFQLGRDVPEADKQAIIAFLSSLVGEKPKGVK